MVGRSRQPTRFMNVDLPEPDGPMTATKSPSSISRETRSRATTRPPSSSYTRLKSRASMSATRRASEQPRPAGPLHRRGLLGCALRARPASDDHARALLEVARQNLGVAPVGGSDAQSQTLRPSLAVEDEDTAGSAAVGCARPARLAHGEVFRPALGVEDGGDLRLHLLAELAERGPAVLVRQSRLPPGHGAAALGQDARDGRALLRRGLNLRDDALAHGFEGPS